MDFHRVAALSLLSDSLPPLFLFLVAVCGSAYAFLTPSLLAAKLSHEGSSGAEQRHVVHDMARVVESAIHNLEQRAEQEKAQPADPSAASAGAEAKAAESTAVHSAAGQPLTESALHDALGIPPPRQMQPHVRDPFGAGKQMPSTYQSGAHSYTCR